MVAADADRAGARQPLDDGIGLGAVADDVTKMPEGIDRADVGEDRVEGEQVGMDVRDDAIRMDDQSTSRAITRVGDGACPGHAGTPPEHRRAL